MEHKRRNGSFGRKMAWVQVCWFISGCGLFAAVGSIELLSGVAALLKPVEEYAACTFSLRLSFLFRESATS